MMINIHAAKTHLSRLVERAAAGEDIVIAKAGVPRARLTSLESEHVAREPGAWRGRVRIAPDFDELPEEVVRSFRGEG